MRLAIWSCLIILFICSYSGQVLAASLALKPHDIRKIENYLNKIETLIAPFTQEDLSGMRSGGIFYLSRPGKLRWDYDPPTPILIVANNSLVSYYDKELNQVSHVNVDDTLAAFLTKRKISFSDGGIKLIASGQLEDELFVTITQEGKEEQGSLTLFFKMDNLDLTKMEIIDSIGKNIIINFAKLTYNTALRSNIFDSPRVKKKSRY